jgi:hypothetical protein
MQELFVCSLEYPFQSIRFNPGLWGKRHPERSEESLYFARITANAQNNEPYVLPKLPG